MSPRRRTPKTAAPRDTRRMRVERKSRELGERTCRTKRLPRGTARTSARRRIRLIGSGCMASQYANRCPRSRVRGGRSNHEGQVTPGLQSSASPTCSHPGWIGQDWRAKRLRVLARRAACSSAGSAMPIRTSAGPRRRTRPCWVIQAVCIVLIIVPVAHDGTSPLLPQPVSKPAKDVRQQPYRHSFGSRSC